MTAILGQAETITDAERERALRYLESTREKLLAAVDGLSATQWDWRAAAERWSAAECLEHITVTENAIFGVLRKVLKEPAQPEKKALVVGKEELILKVVPNRDRKVTAPEEVRPTRRWPEHAELLRQFQATRERSLAFTRTTQEDLRSHFYSHFILKHFDAYQWLLFLGAHCERHTAQIEEVKAAPGFPK